MQPNVAPQSHKNSYRILVADDEPSVRMAYQMSLKHCGHHIRTASDAETALNLMETEPFDLIITDYSMPGIKGDELIAEIKRRKPGQRVIMVTAFGDSAPRAGADYVLSKPFPIEDLRSAIEKVMA